MTHMKLRTSPSPIGRQRGASSMFITVILVLVVMLLAVTAAVLSNTQFKLAGNLQFENQAFNLGEGAVATAENWLATGSHATDEKFTTHDAADKPYLYPNGYLAANSLDPMTMTWSDSNSLAVGGDDSQRYLIEKYGNCNTMPGESVTLGQTLSTTPQKVDVFRISARGASAKGTVKFHQTIYAVKADHCK